MKDLNKSLALLDDFFANTSEEEIHRMMEKVNAMFTSDISFAEYFSLMDSAYDFSISELSTISEYQTVAFQWISESETQKYTVGTDVLPVRLKNDSSYTKECFYNLAA